METIKSLIAISDYRTALRLAEMHGFVAETRKLITEHNAVRTANLVNGINELLSRRMMNAWGQS